MGIRFFVVQTQPGHQQIACKNLENQGFKVFDPTIIIERKHPRYHTLRSSIIEPLFPGYTFVQFDLTDARWRSINGTRGVRGILGAVERPTPVPVGVVEEIQARWASGAFEAKEPSALTVRAGERASVLAGPFAGLIGTCVEARVKRVKLLLNVLGGAVQVLFPPENVVPVAA